MAEIAGRLLRFNTYIYSIQKQNEFDFNESLGISQAQIPYAVLGGGLTIETIPRN